MLSATGRDKVAATSEAAQVIAHINHAGNITITKGGNDVSSTDARIDAICEATACKTCFPNTPRLTIGTTMITHHALADGRTVALPRPHTINGPLRHYMCKDEQCRLCDSCRQEAA
jgi:hypothetical protein